MRLSIEQIELIIFIGVLVALVGRRFRIPYTVGLVIAGIFISFFPLTIEVNFSKELIFDVLLPPLIFEAALYINWRKLRKDLSVIITFATVGVLLSASVTAAFMHFLVGWEWAAAILFGVLIAATDPVSVIATFKEAKVTGRMRLLVEAESLFNDSTAAVAFTIATAFALGQNLSFSSAAGMMALSVFGGIGFGLLVGGGVLLVSGRTRDAVVELALTTIAAFGAFWAAERFHMSGVLATMTAGLILGNTTQLGFVTEKGKESIESFWEYMAFVVNSIIFIALGINEAYLDFKPVAVAIAVAIIAVLVGRAIAIYPISAAFSRSSLKIDAAHQHILFWGGLRGALALALALGIPYEIPYREMIIRVTFGVVAFSVFVQGLTMTPLLGWLGQLPKEVETETT